MSTERIEALEKLALDTSNQLHALRQRVHKLEEAGAASMQESEEKIALAVLQTLKDDVLITQIVERTVIAIEAEWTGKFLPELRRTARADIAEALQHGARSSSKTG
ncbi:MAG: hypothetical protein M8858_08195 [marine benthic group bacterium]|nr:hypothetical protein [Gemmatimonadota bacterium]